MEPIIATTNTCSFPRCTNAIYHWQRYCEGHQDLVYAIGEVLSDRLYEDYGILPSSFAALRAMVEKLKFDWFG